MTMVLPRSQPMSWPWLPAADDSRPRMGPLEFMGLPYRGVAFRRMIAISSQGETCDAAFARSGSDWDHLGCGDGAGMWADPMVDEALSIRS